MKLVLHQDPRITNGTISLPPDQRWVVTEVGEPDHELTDHAALIKATVPTIPPTAIAYVIDTDDHPAYHADLTVRKTPPAKKAKR